MLLSHIRTRRSSDARTPETRYDSERQISVVFEDAEWVESPDSTVLLNTKKADIETGEDAKGQ